MIFIERITVEHGRMSALVTVSPEDAFSTPDRMAQLLAQYPRLERHSCINSKGPTFAAVMDRTSWAHVLEHLVIDMQVSVHQDRGDKRDPWFVGNTQWVDRQAGRARVQVNFYDDLVALQSFRDAARVLNDVMVL